MKEKLEVTQPPPVGIENDSRIAEAKRYSEFRNLGMLAQRLTQIEQTGNPEEYSEEFENLVSQIDGGLDALKKSQETQKKYGLVEKFLWDDSGNPVEAAFKSGARAAEVNIRLSSDSEFIIQHHPTIQKNAALDKSAKGKLVHEMTAEELATETKVVPLDKALKTLSEYQDNDHKLILQLKTLGSGNPEETQRNLDVFQQKLQEYGVADSVVVSSLSPTILAAVHEKMPDMPLIMNTAIAPVISYPEEKSFGAAFGKFLQGSTGWQKLLSTLKNRVDADAKIKPESTQPLRSPRGWVKIPPILRNHISIATAEGAMKAPEIMGGDGHGRNNMYFMTAIPAEIVEATAKQQEQVDEFGGAMSVAAVTIVASVLETLGAKKKPADMRQKAVEKMHSMNLSVQTTTWGGLKNKNGPLRALDPMHQIRQMEQAGFDAEKHNDTFYVRGAGQMGLRLVSVESPK
jgi:hypothetical protein